MFTRATFTSAATGARAACRASFLCVVLSIAMVRDASAQPISEEIEPRIIGRSGTTLVGMSGFIDKFSSSEDVFPTNYTAQVDVCRFLTSRLALRVGAVGTGSLGGEESEELPGGSGVPAFHASGGVLFYFTPQSLVSFYVGGEYWAQLSRRLDRDSGSIVGVAGLHAAVSSRASVFLQGGVGTRIAKGADDEMLSRIVAQVGVRIKL
jgi:hypothetical protein